MRTFIERTEEKLAPQIANFCIIYLNYASLLGANATDMVNLNKGSLFLSFILGMQTKIQTMATTFTAYKDLLLTGNVTSTSSHIFHFTEDQVGQTCYVHCYYQIKKVQRSPASVIISFVIV